MRNRMIIYKILRQSEWAALHVNGETHGAPVDIADGFVHFSTRAQMIETATKHFAGQTGLILAAFDGAMMGAALKWEPSRGGDLFPHLYAPLHRDHVVWHVDLPWVDGAHRFPKTLD